MKSKIIYIIILLLMELFSSCSTAPAEPDLPEGVAISGDEGLIYLNIEDEDKYIFSVNLYNIQSPPVSSIMFEVIFDSLVFEVEDNGVVEIVDYTPSDVQVYRDNYSVTFDYDFTSSISAEGQIATIDFKEKSGGEVIGTVVQFGDVIFLDSSNDYLYYHCVQDTVEKAFDTKGTCEALNYRWELNNAEMVQVRQCYIDEGIVNQAEDTKSVMAEWQPTNTYIWSPAWCAYQP